MPAAGSAARARQRGRGPAPVLLLAVADLGAAVAALLWTTLAVPTVSALVCVLVSRAGFRVYRTRRRPSYLDDLARVLLSTAIGFAAAVCGAVVLGVPYLREIALTTLVFLVLGEVGRAVVTALVGRGVGHGTPTVVVGSGDVGLDLFSTVLARPELGLRPVAVVDPTRPAGRTPSTADRPLGEVITDHRARAVLLSRADTCSEALVDAAITADVLGCSVLLLPRAAGTPREASDVVPLDLDPTRRPSWWIPRAVDVVTAAVALVVLLPLFPVVALAVRLRTGGPVLARQQRVGRDGEPFRSLTFAGPRSGHVTPGSSWRELPQLWNVLRGDMGLVGPRPACPTFAEQFAGDLGEGRAAG